MASPTEYINLSAFLKNRWKFANYKFDLAFAHTRVAQFNSDNAFVVLERFECIMGITLTCAPCLIT